MLGQSLERHSQSAPFLTWQQWPKVQRVLARWAEGWCVRCGQRAKVAPLFFRLWRARRPSQLAMP